MMNSQIRLPEDLEKVVSEVSVKLDELADVEAKLREFLESLDELRQRFEMVHRVLVLQGMEARREGAWINE